MTTIAINRATVEQALEALESLFNWKVDPERGKRCGDAVVTLRAALAQQAEPVGTRALIEECLAAFAEELAAWDIDPPLHHVKQAHDKCEAWLAALAQQAEPVPMPLFPPVSRWNRGCAVCGIGADGKAYGYVCPRSDCPTKVTCGGVA